jgi:transcriptional regulator with XRE-family HTH domain
LKAGKFSVLTAVEKNRLLVQATVRCLVDERRKLGLSAYSWSNRSGISASAISMIESGKREPSLHTLLLLTDGLGVRLGEVLNGLQEVKTVLSEKSETE